MSKIAVSIIIPVYNVEKYLCQCLESVFSQEYSNYEVILINDGSTDNSITIIEEYLKRFDNIILVNQKNCGQSVARNKGIDLAQGEYIYFLDSDDYIDIKAIGELYTEAISNNLDLVIFNGVTFTDSASKNLKNRFNYKKKGCYPDVVSGPEMFKKLIINNDYSCSPCLLFIKRDLIQKSHLRFYEGIIHEDELFTFKLFFISKRVKYINDIYFYRRIRANSTMTSKNYLRSFYGYKTVFKEMLKYKESLSFLDKELQQAINIKISNIYGSALNKYIYMNKNDKQKCKNDIQELIEYGKKNQYFNRLEYRLFGYSNHLYSAFRKIYDILKSM